MPTEETILDVPVRVNVQVSAQVNGQDVVGGRRTLIPATLDLDTDAVGGEIYILGSELRMRSVDGTTSVTITSV